ncbi:MULTISPECIES: hypothetical protein [Pseudomonas]|uniref:hypothetical protein n=1 Tax=Pseudomonas TaxID=286 RepID=UPI001239D577|nr:MULTISPECIES: hypothetical protein [Pseudomonas]QEU31565.1 hypothetical protein FOB45_27835 [Pseudomonas luteola]
MRQFDQQSEMDEELQAFLCAQRAEFEERTYWVNHSLGAESHWLFEQAYEALKHGLYLPACTGFLTGIEASLRNTMAQVNNLARVESVDDISLLSNALLRQARANGISIEALIFPKEENFEDKLKTRQQPVEIVRVRHNFCHGNILEHVRTAYETPFFTPECCRELAETLHMISRNWVASLGIYRKQILGLK